jgi:enoyl-CoA hydratase/carnithine racemase
VNVLYEVERPLGLIRLDRPDKLNAFTFAMVGEIRSVVDAAAADPNVFAIAITGNGRGFSAGLDTSDLTRSASGDPAGRTQPSDDPDELPALFSHLLRVPKPVIAAVNGVAAGGGFVLAMMCDLRFAATSASFTTAFSRRGLVAEHGTSWLLPRLVGLNRALDLMWSARRITAEEAYRIGFVDRLVADDVLLDEVRSYVADLAANVSPRSMAVMKMQLYGDAGLPMADALRGADKHVMASLDHPDSTEGVVSFVERRPPRFAPLDAAKGPDRGDRPGP